MWDSLVCENKTRQQQIPRAIRFTSYIDWLSVIVVALFSCNNSSWWSQEKQHYSGFLQVLLKVKTRVKLILRNKLKRTLCICCLNTHTSKCINASKFENTSNGKVQQIFIAFTKQSDVLPQYKYLKSIYIYLRSKMTKWSDVMIKKTTHIWQCAQFSSKSKQVYTIDISLFSSYLKHFISLNFISSKCTCN